MPDPRSWLLARADSYGRDAVVLRSDGDLPMALAYEAVRDELRKCAADLPLVRPVTDEAAAFDSVSRQVVQSRPWTAPVRRCPAHLEPEPCPTCGAYIAAGL